MISGFNISQREWEMTPSSVRIAALSLNHQLRLFQTRFNLHQQQFTALKERVAQAEQECQAQTSENKLLSGELAKLRERIGVNSNNSSLPPSSDSPFQKPANNHQPSGLKQGAQLGHDGIGRWLLDSNEIDEVIELRPDVCQRCGNSQFQAADWFLPARRQVTEITSSGTKTSEYQRPALRCSSCGKRNRAAWTSEASAGAFGSRVKAVIGYLTGRLGVSHRDTAEAMNELFGVKIAVGSISAVQKRISSALAVPVAQVQHFIEQQPVIYVDETSWREKDRQPWLWVGASNHATAFWILDGRRTSDAQTMIGEDAKGVVTTDRYGGYNFLKPENRQICWAHLKRNFQSIAERDGGLKQLGEGLLEQTKHLFELWRRVRDGTLSQLEFGSEIEPVKHRINGLLVTGAAASHLKTARTCANILRLEKSIWTFTRVAGVEPTNNQAERALRRAVIWRKKSFGTQSATGSRFVERILTVVATLRQQGRSVLQFLAAATQTAFCPSPDER